MEIKLNTKNHGLVKIQIDSDDYARLKAEGQLEGLWVSKKGQHLYVQNRAKKYLHRLIMNPPKGLVVDHIDRNTLDNRKSNLRNVTIQVNLRNQKRLNNTSGHTGVSWHKQVQKWTVRLRHNGKYLSFGLYDRLEDAVNARKRAEQEYWA